MNRFMDCSSRILLQSQRIPKNSMLVRLVVLLALFSWPAFGQSADCTKLTSLKTSIYGFHPTDLNNSQQTAKSAEMDRFWNEAKSEQPDGVRCLRQLILAEKTDTFFLFDASALLYSLDKKPESLDAIARGFNGSDLGDVQIPDYIRMVLQLNRDGVDIGPLAVKYLSYPKVDAFVPQHSLQLDRISGVMLLFGSMPPEAADRYLLPALTAKPDYVRTTTALFLAMNMTAEDFQALRALHLSDLPPNIRKQIEFTLKPAPMKPLDKPAFSREQVIARLRQIPNYDDKFPGVADNERFMSSAIATLTKDDVELVRKARQNSIGGVSDEALYEYVAMSQVLLGVIVRLNLYPEQRGIGGN